MSLQSELYFSVRICKICVNSLCLSICWFVARKNYTSSALRNLQSVERRPESLEFLQSKHNLYSTGLPCMQPHWRFSSLHLWGEMALFPWEGAGCLTEPDWTGACSDGCCHEDTAWELLTGTFVSGNKMCEITRKATEDGFWAENVKYFCNWTPNEYSVIYIMKTFASSSYEEIGHKYI